MLQNYTGYKNPIATGEGYEGVKLSMNCFLKTRIRITALLNVLESLRGVKTEATDLIKREIVRLTLRGETIEEVVSRMLSEGRTWIEIGDYLQISTDLIVNREFK